VDVDLYKSQTICRRDITNIYRDEMNKKIAFATELKFSSDNFVVQVSFC